MHQNKISIIIPCSRKENIDRLKDQLNNQSIKDVEIQVISGHKKASVARNIGAKRSDAEILVFLDDDVEIVQAQWLENLIKPLLDKNFNIGLCGASFLLPPSSNWFERRSAYEYSRYEAPIVNVVTESDLAGSVCAAMKKLVYDEIGGWNEDLITCTDIDLRNRIKQKGYRIVLSPNCWLYHERQNNIVELLKKIKWYYFNSPLMLKNNQKAPRNIFSLVVFSLKYLVMTLLWFIPSIFIQNDEKFKIKFTPFKAIANTYGRLCYFIGLFHFYNDIRV